MPLCNKHDIATSSHCRPLIARQRYLKLKTRTLDLTASYLHPDLPPCKHVPSTCPQAILSHLPSGETRTFDLSSGQPRAIIPTASSPHLPFSLWQTYKASPDAHRAVPEPFPAWPRIHNSSAPSPARRAYPSATARQTSLCRYGSQGAR